MVHLVGKNKSMDTISFLEFKISIFFLFFLEFDYLFKCILLPQKKNYNEKININFKILVSNFFYIRKINWTLYLSRINWDYVFFLPLGQHMIVCKLEWVREKIIVYKSKLTRDKEVKLFLKKWAIWVFNSKNWSIF